MMPKATGLVLWVKTAGSSTGRCKITVWEDSTFGVGLREGRLCQQVPFFMFKIAIIKGNVKMGREFTL